MAFTSPFPNSRASRSPQADVRTGVPVFGVGKRAFVRDNSGRRGVVMLSDVGGNAVGELADDAEVEILAWIPRRAATLYRVHSTEAGIEGWLGVANLATQSRPTSASAAKPTPAAADWAPPQARVRRRR